MINKSKFIGLLCGALSIAVTILFYLLTFGSLFTVPMRWVSLVFLITAEVIGTVKAFTIKPSIYGVSNMVASIIHIAVVFIVSVLFVNVFPLLIMQYILINILALCLLLAVDVVLLYFAGQIESQDDRMREGQSAINACAAKADSICTEYSNTEYKKDLEE